MRGSPYFGCLHRLLPCYLGYTACGITARALGSWWETLAYIYRVSHLSPWLMKSSSVVHTLWWSLIWNPNIHSHMSSYESLPHIFFLYLMGPSSKKKSINCISKLVWHTGVGEKKMEEFLHHLWRTPISYWSKVKAMGFLTLFAFLGCCSCMGTCRDLGQSHAFVSTGKHQEEGEWLAAQSWG